MGFSTINARESRVSHICKVVAEFALEYRTTREKVLQQRQKKANNRERKKTRGKMIVDVSNGINPWMMDSAFGKRLPGGRLDKKDGLTRYGDSHVKDKTS